MFSISLYILYIYIMVFLVSLNVVCPCKHYNSTYTAQAKYYMYTILLLKCYYKLLAQ